MTGMSNRFWIFWIWIHFFEVHTIQCWKPSFLFWLNSFGKRLNGLTNMDADNSNYFFFWSCMKSMKSKHHINENNLKTDSNLDCWIEWKGFVFNTWHVFNEILMSCMTWCLWMFECLEGKKYHEWIEISFEWWN